VDGDDGSGHGGRTDDDREDRTDGDGGDRTDDDRGGGRTDGDDRRERTDDDDGGGSLVVASLRTTLGSESWILRSYGIVGTLLAVFVTLIVALAFPVWVESTLGASQTVTFSRAFLLVSGLLLVAVLLAPMVYAHRRDGDGDRSRRSDALLGASGYLLVGSLYLSLLISAPPGRRGTPPAVLAPLVEFLYGLDPAFAVVPPLAAAVLIGVAGNR